MRPMVLVLWCALSVATAKAADPVVQSVDRTKAGPTASIFKVTFDKDVTPAEAEKAVSFVKAAVGVSRRVSGEPTVKASGKTVTVTVSTEKAKPAGTDFESLHLKERTDATSTYEVRFEKKPNSTRSNTFGTLVTDLDSAQRGIQKEKKDAVKTAVSQDGALSVVTVTYATAGSDKK